MQSESVLQSPRPAPAATPGRITRILVVVDAGAKDHPAVEKAARIAAGCGATLELYVCDTLLEGDMAERSAREERGLALMDRLASGLRARGLVVECRAEWHAPLEEGISLRVLHSKADFVVKDTHRHSLALASGGYGLTDWTLIRQISVPLLLVRPQPWPARPSITVGLDPLQTARRPDTLDESMIAVGSEIANATRGTIDALHVLQEPPHLPGESVRPEARAAAHEHARAEVARLVARCRSAGNPVSLHFEAGRVADRVLAFTAAHAAHILVLGSGAHSRWRHTGASGTAAQILEALGCDLLVVRPPGYVSPLLVTDD